MNRSEGMSYTIVDAMAESLAAGWAALRRMGAAYVEARSRAVAIRHLQAMSDHALRDIGLQRADIIHAVRQGKLPW